MRGFYFNDLVYFTKLEREWIGHFRWTLGIFDIFGENPGSFEDEVEYIIMDSQERVAWWVGEVLRQMQIVLDLGREEYWRLRYRMKLIELYVAAYRL